MSAWMLATVLLFASVCAAAAPIECSSDKLLVVQGFIEGDTLTASVKVFVKEQLYVDAGGIRYVRSQTDAKFFSLDKESAQGARWGDLYFVPDYLRLAPRSQTMVWLPVLGEDSKPAPLLLRVTLTCSVLP